MKTSEEVCSQKVRKHITGLNRNSTRKFILILYMTCLMLSDSEKRKLPSEFQFQYMLIKAVNIRNRERYFSVLWSACSKVF